MKRIKRKEIYKDEWLTFYQDEIELSDGSNGTYSWVERKNGVSIVVVTTDKRILLNHEYRYVIGKYSWEIPGGGIDKGETAEEAAGRELYEETGIKAEKLVRIGGFYPLNSFNTEHITYFYTVVEPKAFTTEKTESGEELREQKYFTFHEVLRMIDSGEIDDAPSANVLQIVIRKLHKSK